MQTFHEIFAQIPILFHSEQVGNIWNGRYTLFKKKNWNAMLCYGWILSTSQSLLLVPSWLSWTLLRPRQVALY